MQPLFQEMKDEIQERQVGNDSNHRHLEPEPKSPVMLHERLLSLMKQDAIGACSILTKFLKNLVKTYYALIIIMNLTIVKVFLVSSY